MPPSLPPIKLDDYKPLREIVFDVIREAIISGQLRPGQRLMEVQVAEELGVSRTPVREAVRKLELEGFVLIIPRKGAYVAGISLREISSVFEVRRALEELAAELAATRANEEEIEKLERLLVEFSECVEKHQVDRFIKLDTRFHAIVYEASRNERLAPILSLLREQIQRFRIKTLSNPGRLRVALEEHRELVEALAQRDAEEAKRLASEHIESAENSLMSIMMDESESE